MIWHNGGTGGFRSWIGFDPAACVGAVVLANAQASGGVDDIGGHIVDPTIDVLTAADFAPKQHRQIQVDSSVYDRYPGRYQLAPNLVISITRRNDRLFAQATGQGRFEIFPESDKDYFAKDDDIQITFVVDAQDRATGLIVHQQGADVPARRIQ